MTQRRNNQLANLLFSPPMNGYEQLVTFIMDAVRKVWRNLEEVELVEDTWRSKLVEAGALPYRPNDKYFRLRHLVDKTCFGVKYDRKTSEQSAFTIYAPLKCYSGNVSALSYIRSIILKQVPELLVARSKGIEYEAEFLQTELLKELQKWNFDIPDCLVRYTKYIQELIQQQKGKLVLDKSDESDDAVGVSLNAQLNLLPRKKKEYRTYQVFEIPSKVDDLYRKQCLPKTADEAERKLKMFILYKMLLSREHSGIDIPDDIFPEHGKDKPGNNENVMFCQLSEFQVLKPKWMGAEFKNGVLKLGNADYTFETCKLRLSRAGPMDPELTE